MVRYGYMSIVVSILQGGVNNHQTTSEEANYYGTDFLSNGVVGVIANTAGVAPTTGAFAINAQGSPNMTVAVSSGVAYVQATPTSGSSQELRVYNNASSNVTISANSSGSTKYDWIYIKIDPDKAKDPNSSAGDVATLVTSRSTSLTADNGTPPTYGYAIAVVTVANGASSIVNGNIKDVRTRTGFQSSLIVANPYKFRARRVSAQNTSAGAFTKVNFDTEDFDTNNNFDPSTNFKYTTPIAGFYQFNAGINVATPGAAFIIALYKNGSEYQRGTQFQNSSGVGAIFSDLLQAAVGDTWEIQVFASSATAITVTTGIQPYFSGHLVSAT